MVPSLQVRNQFPPPLLLLIHRKLLILPYNYDIMKVSDRVKRNIHLALLILGIACIVARAWDVALNPASGRAWFELFSIIFLTYFCFDSFRTLRRN